MVSLFVWTSIGVWQDQIYARILLNYGFAPRSCREVLEVQQVKYFAFDVA